MDRPTVVALKHMNPCGIGQADDIETAWDYAYEADPVLIFGGIVVLNREVDAATAKKMHGVFLEIIIAPSYSDEALEILTTKKKKLRILELPFDAQDASEVEAEYTGVVGGLPYFDGYRLVQITDFHLGSFPPGNDFVQKVVDAMYRPFLNLVSEFSHHHG